MKKRDRPVGLLYMHCKKKAEAVALTLTVATASGLGSNVLQQNPIHKEEQRPERSVYRIKRQAEKQDLRNI
jgi:hypothetical protein